jgi:hypothetical protein
MPSVLSTLSKNLSGPVGKQSELKIRRQTAQAEGLKGRIFMGLVALSHLLFLRGCTLNKLKIYLIEYLFLLKKCPYFFEESN